MDYCKPFEHEIRQRFEDIYKIYAKVKPKKRSDIGAIINMLVKFKKLPPGAQKKIVATGTTLHNMRKLLERINHVMIDYRNPGAHPNEYPEDVLSRLFNILFEEGVLLAFIDALKRQ